MKDQLSGERISLRKRLFPQLEPLVRTHAVEYPIDQWIGNFINQTVNGLANPSFTYWFPLCEWEPLDVC